MEQRYSHEQIEAINLCKEMNRYKKIVSYSLDTCDIISDKAIVGEMIMFHNGIIRLMKKLHNLTDEDIDDA